MAHRDSEADEFEGRPTVRGFGRYGRTDFHSLPGGRHVQNVGLYFEQPIPYPVPDYLESDPDRGREPDDPSPRRG